MDQCNTNESESNVYGTFVIEQPNVKELLSLGKVEVVFTKKDGTTRVMNCSLSKEFVPEQLEMALDEGKKIVNPDVQAVYDIEAEGWRSFRWDNVQTVNGIEFCH